MATRPGLSPLAFTEQLMLLGLSARSIRQYVRTVQSADRWFVGRRLDLARATAPPVVAYAETKPKTFASRNLLRAALTHYWSIVGHLAAPIKAIRVPPKPRMVCRALEPPAAARLAAVAVTRADRQGLAVLLALYLGLRREEISVARWDAFAGDGWYKVVAGKGDKEAILPVHPVLLRAVLAFPRRSAWLFPGRSGTRPVCPATIWAWVQDVTEEAGLGRVAPHVLRHTCLATANDATGDLRAVQEFARHSKPETTAGYTRATARRLTEVMMSLDYDTPPEQAGGVSA